MHKSKRRRILTALNYTTDNTGGAGAAGGQGAGSTPPPLPPGVVEGSPAADAFRNPANKPPAGDQGDDAGRAGGPDALKADLAAERRKRHEAEQAATAAKDAAAAQLEQFKKALGISEGQTPEQLQAAATEAQNKAKAAQVQLSVYQLAKDAGANPDALLDSASFLSSISAIDPSDKPAVVQAMKDAVARNKSLSARVVAAGAGDAGQGSSGSGGQATIDDALRSLVRGS